jgi:hypothetical protein
VYAKKDAEWIDPVFVRHEGEFVHLEAGLKEDVVREFKKKTGYSGKPRFRRGLWRLGDEDWMENEVVAMDWPDEQRSCTIQVGS